MTDDKKENVVLDYRCKRCGAPFIREAQINCTAELAEYERRFHHCENGGVGIGMLTGFHNRRRRPTEGSKCRCDREEPSVSSSPSSLPDDPAG